MKTITVTYDAMTIEDGEKITGETCMNITLMDFIADNLIRTGQSGVAIAKIEKALAPLEHLQGRIYVKGSIKDIREAKPRKEIE